MYGRIIRLEARYELEGDPFFVTDELRIQVDMRMGLTQQLAQTSVLIYNLSLENARALCAGDLEPASKGDATEKREPKRVYVRIFAGYKDEPLSDGKPPLLLEGLVMNASSRRAIPNYITQLYVVPLSARFLREKPNSYTPEGPVTLKEVLVESFKRAGYLEQEITFEVSEEFLKKELRGRTFDYNKDVYEAMSRLGKEFKFYFGCRARGVGIYPALDDTAVGHREFNYLMENGQPYKVTPQMLRGTPSIGTATITLPIVFDAILFPGMVLSTDPVQGEKSGDISLPSDGLADYSSMGDTLFYVRDISKYTVFSRYMALEVIHQIDNYSATWITTVIGTVPSTGDQTKNEIRIRGQ